MVTMNAMFQSLCQSILLVPISVRVAVVKSKAKCRFVRDAEHQSDDKDYSFRKKHKGGHNNGLMQR